MSEDNTNPSPIERQFVTPRLLDLAKNPPEYVDGILPTVSVAFRGPIRRGAVRAPRGSILGSYSFSGSYYPTGMGTTSLRITRVNVFSGSRNQRWMIRHSRDGTRDIRFFISPGQQEIVGNPMEPIYVFGPGTISWGFIGANASGSMGSAYDTSQFMEGYRG